jgi:diacylglycerol kinase (ATP)
MQNARLIYNPAAGRFPAGRLLERAELILSTAGWETETVAVDGEKDLVALAQDAVDAECTAVFVAGGDGSIGQVASVLAGSSTALGVLPAGTANVWAQELGLPRLNWIQRTALRESAERLANATVRLVDIGICNDHSFLLWAGFGLDADIVNFVEPRERWEKIFATAHYTITALSRAVGWKGVDVRAEADSLNIRGRFLFAVACNIPGYAGGLLDLAPGAKVDDGLLDFWLIGGQTVGDVFIRAFQIFQGKHINASGVVHFRSDQATFFAGESFPVQFDGEPVQMSSPLKFTVKKKTLKVLVPSGTNPRLFSETTPAGTEVG